MFRVEKDISDFQRVLEVNGGTILGMVLKAAAEFHLFEIMAKAASVDGASPFGDDAKMLSTDDIVALLPTQNPAAAAMLERILRFLTANSFLKRTLLAGEDGEEKSFYSLESACKFYIPDEDGVSLAPLLVMLHDKVYIDSWLCLKDALLEGGIPFNKAHDGMHAFEYPAIDSRFNDVFNQGMYNHTTIIMRIILEDYTGFEEVTDIVDVGGGTGATLAQIISKYPRIRGINFDLPHVIKKAAPLAGVDHVGGDMFESVPKGEVIFMKWILHDWSDEHCIKLLKNCFNALPECGKVIIVDSVVPEYTNTGPSPELSYVTGADMVMLAMNPGGKERSLKEFEALAKESGFAAVELISSIVICNVLEFHKKV